MKSVLIKIGIISIGLFLLKPINSQINTDSLKKLLKTDIPDTVRINKLINLSTIFAERNQDSAIFYAVKAYQSAEEIENTAILAKTSCKLADIYFYKGELSSAIDYYKIAAENEKITRGPVSDQYAARLGDIGYCFSELGIYDISVTYFDRALEIVRKTGNIDEIYTNINNKGLVFHAWGEYDKAIDAFSEVLEFDKKQNNFLNISSSYNNIGKVYESWGKYAQTTDYYKKALEYAQRTGNLSKIAVCYGSLGMIFFKLKDFDKALNYMNKARELDQKEGNIIKVAIRQNGLAKINTAKGDYKSAVEYNLKALKTFKDATVLHSQSIVYKDLGDIFKKTGKYAQSEKNYLSAADIAKKIGSVNDELYACKGLSDLYKKTGQFQKSLTYYIKYDSLSTIIFNKENNKHIVAFEKKYETEKKEKEIEILKNEALIKDIKLSRSKILWVSLLLISVLLISIAVILIKRNKLKAKINNVLSEKNKELNILNATKTKFFAIISHDLLNPLSAIHRLANAMETSFNEIEKEQLYDFIKELNRSSEKTYLLLQNLLSWASVNNGRMKYQPTEAELNIIVEKVLSNIQANANEKQIEIITDIKDNTQVYIDTLMISTVLRNLISNAIKFSNMHSQIHIYSEEFNDTIEITVKDSGIGMHNEDLNKLFRIDVDINEIGDNIEKGTGLGLILCKELTEKCGGKISVKSELNKGSEFKFTVPKKKQ